MIFQCLAKILNLPQFTIIELLLNYHTNQCPTCVLSFSFYLIPKILIAYKLLVSLSQARMIRFPILESELIRLNLGEIQGQGDPW